MLELALAALALWGFSGMHITVESAYPSQPSWLAEAWPTDDYSACRIVVHPNLDERAWPGVLFHEVGHCVGVYEHSHERGSVMESGGYSGRILVSDWLTAKATRDQRLAYRVALPGIAY